MQRAYAWCIGDGSYEWESPTIDEYLIPEQLVWGSNGHITTLSLRFALSRWNEKYRLAGQIPWRQGPETLHKLPAAGDKTILQRIDGPDEVTPLFVGYIGQEGLLIQASPDAESYTLTAYGRELLLGNKVIHGQWHKNHAADQAIVHGNIPDGGYTHDAVFQTDLPCIVRLKCPGRDCRTRAGVS